MTALDFPLFLYSTSATLIIEIKSFIGKRIKKRKEYSYTLFDVIKVLVHSEANKYLHTY